MVPTTSKSSSKVSNNNNSDPHNFYIIDPEVLSMTADEVLTHRNELGIIVHDETDALTYKTLKSFDYLKLTLKPYCPFILDYFKSKNFKIPSPIQSQCWPPMLSGRDVIGIAATGSGKTLGFLVPGMLMLAANPKIVAEFSGRPKPSPRMLILAPTR